ncbi:hypothetical protein KAK07_25040 [Ideonella sp. 4Y16]|uniref:hypothetical protein n=1 Tax=Ideonella alba TaxID=2824118 RepID=UPI001B3639BB|nr:hypothetical protein [Ideonella alba]MBQ0946616.1 hypothetical protein [Ideonella alba]
MLGAAIANPILVLLQPAVLALGAALVIKYAARLVQVFGVPGIRSVPLGVLAGAAVVLGMLSLLIPTFVVPFVVAPIAWALFHVWFVHEEARKSRPWLALLASISITAWSALGIWLLVWPFV